MPEEMRFSLDGSEVKVATLMNSDGRLRVTAYSPLGADPKGLRIAVGLDPDITFASIVQADRRARRPHRHPRRWLRVRPPRRRVR